MTAQGERIYMLIFYLSVMDIPSDKLDFEKFYRLYKDDVFAYALSLLKNREDAEDASQNTWLWLAKNFKLFRTKDEISVRVYIMRVVRSRAIDIYRKNKRDEKMLAKELESEQNASQGNEDYLLYNICKEEEVAQIIRCIKMLDEKYRDVLNLYYLNHSTTAEIAKILSIKENTARQRLARGRRLLISLLKERGIVQK